MASARPPKARKYVFVVGGVMSGVGKGITASSIAMLIEAHGYHATAIKIDPYINVDAGTMNPTEHGEVFVLNDGDETDQDMGNYERFLDADLSRDNYMTTGRVYRTVIDKERNLKYKGKCVQVVPHIPMEIIERIESATAKAKADVAVIEIGGTVGEYENILFIESARMMALQHPGDVRFVMVSYLPVPGKIGEMKTKPTQHAVRALNATGVQPDFLVARSSEPIDDVRREKIALYCNMRPDRVISAPDVDSIYDVPLNFEKQHIGKLLLESLNLRPKKKPELSAWKRLVARTKNGKKTVNIAIVGKYFNTGSFVLADSYISVIEALKYSAWHLGVKVKLTWLSAEEYEKNPRKVKELSKYDGVLIPGGFGSRGVEGKLKAIEYVRTHKIPYFGLCYGMQLLTVEYARNVLKLRGANTVEIDEKSPHPIIDIMPDQKKKLALGDYGGSMRLGAYVASLSRGSIARGAYGRESVVERHRHRYEVNPTYVGALKKGGLVFSGTSPDGTLMEIAELPRSKHPFFLGTQFHPEFRARPLRPHPLFTAFMRAALGSKKK